MVVVGHSRSVDGGGWGRGGRGGGDRGRQGSGEQRGAAVGAAWVAESRLLWGEGRASGGININSF